MPILLGDTTACTPELGVLGSTARGGCIRTALLGGATACGAGGGDGGGDGGATGSGGGGAGSGSVGCAVSSCTSASDDCSGTVICPPHLGQTACIPACESSALMVLEQLVQANLIDAIDAPPYRACNQMDTSWREADVFPQPGLLQETAFVCRSTCAVKGMPARTP